MTNFSIRINMLLHFVFRQEPWKKFCFKAVRAQFSNQDFLTSPVITPSIFTNSMNNVTLIIMNPLENFCNVF